MFRNLLGKWHRITEEENMRLFWKYFFQGYFLQYCWHYFNVNNGNRQTSMHAINYGSSNDRFMYDFQAVSSDFTKVYNKITETKK